MSYELKCPITPLSNPNPVYHVTIWSMGERQRKRNSPWSPYLTNEWPDKHKHEYIWYNGSRHTINNTMKTETYDWGEPDVSTHRIQDSRTCRSLMQDTVSQHTDSHLTQFSGEHCTCSHVHTRFPQGCSGLLHNLSTICTPAQKIR